MATWQVGASTDDCMRLKSGAGFFLTGNAIESGANGAVNYQYGSGMRFTNITILKGSTIDSAKLTLTDIAGNSGTVCRTRISAEDVDDAITFADDGAAFDTRWAARTTARVDWDGIAAWTVNLEYDSPEIKTVIQEIIDRDGWASGQDMVIFWDDFDDRSDHNSNANREGYAWDSTPAKTAKLVITWTEPVATRGWMSK